MEETKVDSDAVIANMNSYFFWLGAFVQKFSEVETALKWALVILKRTELDDAHKFSRLSVKQAITEMRRIRASLGPDPDRDLEMTLGQLELINSVRNLLLHHGVQFNKTEMVTTDQMVRALADTRRTEITPHMIGLMTTDLGTIAARIVAISARSTGFPVPYFPLPPWGWQYRPNEHVSLG